MEAFKGKTYDIDARWQWIFGFDDRDLFKVLRELFCNWCDVDPDKFEGREPSAIDSLAGILGLDFVESWRVDQDYLELHTEEQLAALMRDWKIKTPTADKSAKINAILAEDSNRRLPMPKVLAKLK